MTNIESLKAQEKAAYHKWQIACDNYGPRDEWTIEAYCVYIGFSHAIARAQKAAIQPEQQT
jgi:hypothetical protein